MDRRQFLAASAATSAAGVPASAVPPRAKPGYPSPAEAMKAKPEKYAFVACSYAGTDVWEPDFLASVDVNPDSANYSKVVSRAAMPIVGDEVFRFGWNVCSSSHKTPSNRMYVLLPGLRSGRINVVNVEVPERLWMHKTIEPTTILDETGCTVPSTVRPLPTGDILVSTIGHQSYLDRRTLPKGPGLCLLDADFKIKKRWDTTDATRPYMDFWYQTGVKHPVLVSTMFATPMTFMKGFDPRALEGKNGFGQYPSSVQVWKWNDPSAEPDILALENGHGTLPVRFLHNPKLPQGYVGAVISGTVWLIVDGLNGILPHYRALKVIEVEPVKVDGRDIRAMTTDLVISMDDKFLYLSNWLHGDVRQYDISERGKPKLTGQIFLGGVLGKGVKHGDKKLWGGPQSLQLSLDGKRLYVTNSFFSAWDNQFYPEMAERGSWMVQLDCDTQKGGLTLNEKFFVHFGREFGNGAYPSRAREMHLDTGDCTSDIFV
ncbi:selenium-binding protein SBP56-related protein [Gemmata sp.]|uniref:selenium-binding protein SBP56-related protein n=1 Tax=Gemmata sp. TaxID=1914242 RepID=UPI003F6EE111